MPTPLQQVFVDAIKARLILINGTGEYLTAPKNVTIWQATPFEKKDFPSINIRDLENDVNQQDKQRIRGKQDNSLHFQIEIWSDDVVELRQVIADVWTAINQDREWSYKAIDTRPLKVRIMAEHEGIKVAGALVDIAIDYISGTFNAYS